MPPDVEGTPPAAQQQQSPTETNGASGAPPEQQIPYSRFKTQGDQLRTAQERIASLETETTTLRSAAAAADAFRRQAATAEAKYESHFGIARALGQFEPDVIEVVEYAIGKLPEAERTAGAPKILEAWKADPTKAPPSVRPHFQPPPAQPGQQQARPVDQHKNVLPAQGSPGTEKTAQDLYSMSNEDYIQWSNAERAKRGLPPHPTRK